MLSRIAGFREGDISDSVWRKMRLWKVLRALPQNDLNNKIIARVLNAIQVGTRRGQMSATVTIMIEIETQPMSYSFFMRKAELACEEAMKLVRPFGYTILTRFDFVRRSDGSTLRSLDGVTLVSVLDVYVSRLQKVDPDSLRDVREELFRVTSLLPNKIKKRSKKKKKKVD